MLNADPPDLIPVRALNQVSYCPRLYFLESCCWQFAGTA